ncbi:TPA: four-carbon acid sugar kinase family protein [Streptococcus suis]
MRLLVIADDFTGALDTGVQFSNLGIKTLVTTNYQQIMTNDDIPDVQVLVVDTESRYLSPGDAYARVSELIKWAQKTDIKHIYKKVDSALRGNVAGEICAIVDQFPQEMIPFIPAFPEINRIVKDGKLYIDGIPVDESVFGKDPYEPVTESNILQRLFDEQGIKGSLCRSANTIENQTGLILFDSETSEDLNLIADMLLVSNQFQISVGCAGFAKQLANKLFPMQNHKYSKEVGGLVVICGSVNEVTEQQIIKATQSGAIRYSLTCQQLMDNQYWNSKEGKLELTEMQNSLKRDEIVIFETLSQQTKLDLNKYKETNNQLDSDIRFKIGQALGVLSQFLLENDSRTFLFTGGDTLFQCMKVLGVEEISPLYELADGVVVSQFIWKDKRIMVITKSGGFGAPELFIDIHQLHKNERG